MILTRYGFQNRSYETSHHEFRKPLVDSRTEVYEVSPLVPKFL